MGSGQEGGHQPMDRYIGSARAHYTSKCGSTEMLHSSKTEPKIDTMIMNVQK